MTWGIYLGIGLVCSIIFVIIMNLCDKWYAETCFPVCVLLIPFWIPMIIITIVFFIMAGVWYLLTKGDGYI